MYPGSETELMCVGGGGGGARISPRSALDRPGPSSLVAADITTVLRGAPFHIMVKGTNLHIDH